MKVEHPIEVLSAFPENVVGHSIIHKSAPYIVLLFFLNLKLTRNESYKMGNIL
jgi:hypothetical protein